MSDGAAKVRLDVRWDRDTVERASTLATARRVRPAVVMREAVRVGLDVLEGKTVAAMDVGYPDGLVVVEEAASPLATAASERAGKMPGARSLTPPGEVVQSPTAAPRPAVGGAPSQATTQLELVVARLLGRNVQGPIPPADRMRARRAVEQGRVSVAGEVVKDPKRLVDRTAVLVAP